MVVVFGALLAASDASAVIVLKKGGTLPRQPRGFAAAGQGPKKVAAEATTDAKQRHTSELSH